MYLHDGAVEDADGEQQTPPTASRDYAEELVKVGQKRWKKVLNVQAPFKAHIQHLKLGRTLDVGCGTGRNLRYLSPESIGVDHNPFSVQVARDAGLTAFQSDAFWADRESSVPRSFDSLLAAHVIEHVERDAARPLLAAYLPLVKIGGRVVLITPQELGHYGGFDHISFTDFAELRSLSHDLGLEFVRQYSFPFPRLAGKVFRFNEFVSISRVRSS